MAKVKKKGTYAHLLRALKVERHLKSDNKI